jgi:thioredoxin reductase
VHCLLLPAAQVLWDSVVVEAYGNEKGLLGGVKVENLKSRAITDLPLGGLFFAIGHEPATKFLEGQLKVCVRVRVCAQGAGAGRHASVLTTTRA